MGLVDGDQGHAELLERRNHAVGEQTLRGHVKQPDLAAGHPAPDLDIVAAALAGMNGARRNAGEIEGGDLIIHEGDERRDDHRQSAKHQRRQLIAQRLAGARGHDRQHRPAGEHMIDDPLLPRPEGIEPERLPEHPALGRVQFGGQLDGSGHHSPIGAAADPAGRIAGGQTKNGRSPDRPP